MISNSFFKSATNIILQQCANVCSFSIFSNNLHSNHYGWWVVARRQSCRHCWLLTGGIIHQSRTQDMMQSSGFGQLTIRARDLRHRQCKATLGIKLSPLPLIFPSFLMWGREEWMGWNWQPGALVWDQPCRVSFAPFGTSVDPGDAERSPTIDLILLQA